MKNDLFKQFNNLPAGRRGLAMKQLFRKFTIFSFILLLILQSFPAVSFAQEATPSAMNSDSSSATSSSSLNSSPFDDAFVNASLVPANNTPSYIPPLVFPSLDTVLPGSANLNTNQNKKWTVAPNTKHDFKGDETYQVNINDISPQNVQTEVFDSNGNHISVNFNKIATVNGTSIQILPPKNFKPGKYTLKLTDSSGNVTTQDFTWGVLAINTNKSIFFPNETANLAMAVLDDTGAMVCDANVTLTIMDPSGSTTTLSTSNGKIKVNPECQVHDYTEKPDYEASYQTSTAGTYNMILTASISNGIRTITDSFQVQNSVPFDIERQTGTRIFPPATYPVNFNIKTNKDFKGQIIEYVPNSFTIYASTNSAAPSFDVKQIATPVQNESGILSSLRISLPFNGTYNETLGFGQRLIDSKQKDLYAKFGLLGHDGLDFEMPIGTSVLASDEGTVVMAGGEIYGTTVVIQHSWGRSYYGHLSKVTVTLGQVITKGQEIALSGNTGLSTGPHLHFGIKLNSNDPANGFYGKIDPGLYLGIQSQPQIAAANINDTVKAIVFDVDVKKGDTLNLSYSFVAPSVSPQFYTLGPLSFAENNEVVFQEARVWQIAADQTTETFTASTTWVAPTGVTSVTAEVWGGGGGGGGQNLASDGGGGGGGGAYSKQTAITVTPGNSYTVTVGALGAGGTSGCGGTGGDSSFVNTSTVLAKGGVGGCNSTGTPPAGGLGGAAASGVGGTKFDGGQGEIGKNNATGVGGYGGSSAGTAAVGWSGPQTWSTEIYPTASTPTGGGHGGDGGAKNANGVAPVSGNGGGGGGSGEGTAMTGGNGTVGKVILTYNKPPNAPSQDSPLDSTIVSVIPTFLMTATDADTSPDNLQYKVTIYSDACTTAVQTNDQSVSQTGWTGQNATCVSGSDCYTSGTQGSYATQTALSYSTPYWWRASAKDPLGSNTFTNSSTCKTFTTQASGPTLDQLLRHGAWFNSSGVEQPFTF